MAETNPETGVRWADRYGTVYYRGKKEFKNIEPYLSYKKLHRTGRLLRGLKVKRIPVGNSVKILLYNNVPYAEEHQTGKVTQTRKIRGKYVMGGVSGVIVGGNLTARPFMTPSKQVLSSARSLLYARMKEYGWL